MIMNKRIKKKKYRKNGYGLGIPRYVIDTALSKPKKFDAGTLYDKTSERTGILRRLWKMRNSNSEALNMIKIIQVLRYENPFKCNVVLFAIRQIYWMEGDKISLIHINEFFNDLIGDSWVVVDPSCVDDFIYNILGETITAKMLYMLNRKWKGAPYLKPRDGWYI